MKKIFFVLLTVLMIGCGSDQNNHDLYRSIVPDVLEDFSAIEDVEDGNGIKQFQQDAFKEANEQINFTEKNIEDMLNEAENYKHCFILIEDHTIVKVLDYEDCKQSGSWGACMPYVEGYIKKGSYDYQEDYMNNIIGLPDDQKRTAYLFN